MHVICQQFTEHIILRLRKDRILTATIISWIMSISNEQFSARIFDCVHKALSRDGTATTESILIRNFQKKSGLSALDIEKNPEAFVNCIYEIFGPGAMTIELKIAAEICSEFRLSPSSSPSGIANLIKNASTV